MCSYPTCSYVLLLIAIIPIHHPLLTCKEGTYYVLCTTLILYTYRWLRKTPKAPSPPPLLCPLSVLLRPQKETWGQLRGRFAFSARRRHSGGVRGCEGGSLSSALPLWAGFKAGFVRRYQRHNNSCHRIVYLAYEAELSSRHGTECLTKLL